jgi:asparagine synthase (glutamine-hydrolysing)
LSGFFVQISQDGTPVRAETWPVVRAGGAFALAADLRLDNRAELCAVLGDLEERRATDAEILLAAYERWGDDCPRHLVGDFAFALWDGRRRRLLCARDPIGVCPLYYTVAGGRLIAASTLEAVLAALPSPAEINQPFLRDLVDSRFDRWVEETSYSGVLRLPPGHRMVLENEGEEQRLALARYWTFGTESGPPLRRDEEYLERFRELFLAAVGSRMRGFGPVGVLVSGGMDSSAIACAAHHLVETGVLPADTDLRFYSAVFSATPGAEEREYAEAVARRCPRARMTYVPGDDCWGLSDFATDGGYPLAEPEIGISRALVLRLLRQARKDGCRVVLTGIGGDQVLGGEPYHRPGGLRDVEGRRLLAEIPHFRRSSRRTTAGLFAEAWLRPAVPAPLRRAVRRLRSGPPRAVERDRRLPETPGFPTLAARESFRYLTEGSFSARLAGLRIASDHAGVETRLPFLDRRLIDFMLTVPARVRFRNGWIKWVLRQSLEGILAEEVRQRTRLAWFSALAHRGLRERARDRVLGLLADSRLVQVGLASEGTLWQDWNSYWSSVPRFAPPQTLISFLCAESWLRAREPMAAAPELDEHERYEIFA